MSSGIYVAYSGAVSTQADLEVIANNLANVSTAGFLRDRTVFDTVYGNTLGFARADGARVDLSPGTQQLTGDPLHAALDGDGFFAVVAPSGEELYTRRGDFHLDNGRLVLPNGYAVQGQGGDLATNRPGARLDPDGRLFDVDGEKGQLRIVHFEDPSALQKHGAGLLRAGAGAVPQELESPRVAVGFVETSNVNMSLELVRLIEVTRTFEATMRALQMNDELQQSLIQAQTT